MAQSQQPQAVLDIVDKDVDNKQFDPELETIVSLLGPRINGVEKASDPIAFVTYNSLPNEIPQLLLSANIGTSAALLPFVIRLRVGWGFVSKRLRDKAIYYEAQQSGLIKRKDKEVGLLCP